MHEIHLDRYTPTPAKIMLGTCESYGVEQVKLVPGDGWGGLDMVCTWHPPMADPVRMLVPEGGVVDVPPEATARSGIGTLVVAGMADGVLLASCDVEYRVRRQSGVAGKPADEPTPDLVQQVVGAANRATAVADGVRKDMGKVLAAETGRETAETARAAAEAAREKAESARAAAEKSRETAESDRVTAETARQQAEADRKSAEDGRAAAESARQTDETTRQQAETTRKISESARESAEADRVKSEKSRASAESNRASAESKRASAESARTSAETKRASAESARENSENHRVSAENHRVTSEQARETAEAGRVNAETARVEAETEREKQLPALSHSVDELQARQNILVGSETGNPVSCNDAYSAPLCGLTIYGKSTQDGTPPPDAPVPIVSAGDGGTVTVKVTGVNLLDLNEISDLVLGASQSTVKDGHITGTTKSIYAEIGFILKGESAQYTVSLSGGAAGVSTELRVYIWDNNSLANNVMSKTVPAGEKASCTFKTDGKHEYAVWFRPNGVSDYDFYDIQLELGSTVTAYEPYHEQLLTLQTPTGLPGIPVTSGGNYTDSRGQQWVCDEVDLAGEVMVQRIDKAALDDTKPLAEQNAILATPIETPLTADEIAAYKALTAYAPDTVVQASDGAGVKLEYQRDVNIAIKKLEDAVASMTTT